MACSRCPISVRTSCHSSIRQLRCFTPQKTDLAQLPRRAIIPVVLPQLRRLSLSSVALEGIFRKRSWSFPALEELSLFQISSSSMIDDPLDNFQPFSTFTTQTVPLLRRIQLHSSKSSRFDSYGLSLSSLHLITHLTLSGPSHDALASFIMHASSLRRLSIIIFDSFVFSNALVDSLASLDLVDFLYKDLDGSAGWTSRIANVEHLRRMVVASRELKRVIVHLSPSQDEYDDVSGECTIDWYDEDRQWRKVKADFQASCRVRGIEIERGATRDDTLSMA